jgi:tight adherence protein C
MELSSLIFALPVFFIVYQIVDMIFSAQERKKWGGPSSSDSSGSSEKVFRQFASLTSKLGFNKALLRNKALNERLELLLLRSGYPFGWKTEDFLLCKEVLAIVMLGLMFRIEAPPLILLLGLGLGFWLPDVYMKGKAAARQASIQKQLPGFIDLTSLTLESGLDLLAAIERIIEKMKPSSLREELAMLIQESRLGTPRKETLENFSFRINLPDVQSLTSIIIQSEELGTSLASVLRTFAEDMRNKRILRAEEIAGKMPVKLLFPMMVFFFPIVFVLIFGPLALNFMSGYK